MSKYVIVTKDWSGLGFAITHQRKHPEDEVIIGYNPEKTEFKEGQRELYKLVGKGLIETFPLKKLFENRSKMKDWYWVWDGNHNVEVNETLKKEGFKVWGGGKFCYQMENDREFGIKVAEAAGIKSPMWVECKSVKDGIKFLQANPDKAFVFKPNGGESHLTTVISTKEPDNANLELQQFIESVQINDFILQERVKGIEVNVEYLVVDGVAKACVCNLENKRAYNHELGSLTGCQFDVCWAEDVFSPIAELTIAKLLPLCEKLKYTGFADMNCIIAENEVWFIEWCWRPGYNAHPNLFNTISNKTFLQTAGEMIDGNYEADFKRGFGASISVNTDHPYRGIPIYMPDNVENSVYLFDSMKGKNGIEMTGWSEEILIATGYDYNITDAFHEALEVCDKIKFANKQYRTDQCEYNYPNNILKRHESLRREKLTV